jgi:hypothetical protein
LFGRKRDMVVTKIMVAVNKWAVVPNTDAVQIEKGGKI